MNGRRHFEIVRGGNRIGCVKLGKLAVQDRDTFGREQGT